MPETTSAATAAAATTAASGTLTLKIITVLLPVCASLLAFWLGLRFVPVRPGHERADMINRVMGCLFSSFILGIATLVLLYERTPGLFAAAGNLAEAAFLPRATGFFLITGCTMVVCAIPGPWIVAGVFVWLERRKGQDIGQMLNDLRRDMRGYATGADLPRGEPLQVYPRSDMLGSITKPVDLKINDLPDELTSLNQKKEVYISNTPRHLKQGMDGHEFTKTTKITKIPHRGA